MLFCNISNIPNVSPHARHKTNNKQNKELSSDSFIHFIDPADLKNRILKYYTITNASFTTKKKNKQRNLIVHYWIHKQHNFIIH